MRAAFFLLFATLGASADQARVDPTARYVEMMEQSPFALATAIEAPAQPTESFAANWELTGLAKLRNEKGEEKDFVTIRSRDHRISLTLFGNEENNDEETKGVSLQSVTVQEGSRKSFVTLKKGNELAKVEFSQDAAPPPQPPGAPNAAAMNANQVRNVQLQAQQAQQLQQARLQGMQPGQQGGGGVFNPAAAGVQRPGLPNPNGAFKAGVANGSVLNANGSMIPSNGVVNNGGVNNGGVIYPQPTGVINGVPSVPTDPRKRLRVIQSHP